MTSIIGYTRVPFNSSSSKHFTIAPVKQVYQTDGQQNYINNNLNNNVILDQNKSTTRRPTYHRMFSREMNRDGMMELIVDKKPPSITNKTNHGKKQQDNVIGHFPQPNLNTKGYNVVLSIDLYEYHNLSLIDTSNNNNNNANETSFNNLQLLMDSITKIIQEKTIYYVKILNLLKKLQSEQYQFMSCIDKENEKILVYFPNTLSFSVEQTHNWLKNKMDIDIHNHTQWKLSHIVKIEKEQVFKNNAPFDGESYFNDIHMFINHVDSLIESNALFSHHRNQEPIV